MRIAPPDIFFLKGNQPGWTLPAAGLSLDFNFANGLYFGGNVNNSISLSRASVGLAQDTGGTWYSFSANIPRITNQGFLIEEARTNKCTNYNANPPALVTMGTAAAFNAAVTNMVATAGSGSPLFGVVDQSATLANSIGLNVVNGRVYHINNTSGTSASTVLVGGTTGNTNAHSLSVYMWGSGQARVRASSFAPAYVSISATPTRYTNANFTPASSSVSLIVDANIGADVYFILADMEEGAFVTSPIIVAGSSAARAADVPQLIGPASMASLAAKSALLQTSGMSNGTAPHLLYFSDGFIIYNSTTTASRTFFSGANKALGTFGSGTTAGVAKTATGMDASGTSVIANAGTKGTDAAAVTQNTGSVYIGNKNTGDRALNGYLQRFALSNIKGVFDSMTGS